jgi:hypothetical protein
MNGKTISPAPDQQRWKQLFEGSLNRLNGRAVPISQQPIFRLKQNRTNNNVVEPESSKAAIEAAASSLAALWQISTPKRHTL